MAAARGSVFKKVIALQDSGKSYPALKMVRQDPGLAAVISKMVRAPTPPTYDQVGNRSIENPQMFQLRDAAERTARSQNDAETVLQTLPDIELAIQVLTSLVLSPSDMETIETNFTAPEGLLPADLAASCIGRVREHFERSYRIKPLLPRMLRDIMFITGSYPVAVIPENSIDEMINGRQRLSMEALGEYVSRDGEMYPIGLLGPVNNKKPTALQSSFRVALESLDPVTPVAATDGKITMEGEFGKPVDTFLSVTDNPSIFKIPRINQRIREERIMSAMGVRAYRDLGIAEQKALSLEADQAYADRPAYMRKGGQNTTTETKLNDREMSRLIYKNRNYNYTPVTALKTQEQLNRYAVGNPLILHLPSESVIPVYVPGCVEQQIGFFVLLDQDGNPLARGPDVDYYSQLTARMNTGGSFPSAMLQKVKSNMNGWDCNDRNHLDYAARVYADMVEQDLLARLRNGVYGNGVALARREEIYRLMLARTLSQKHTQLLFVPIELMTYFAFKFNADGIGKTWLEDLKIVNSLRAMVTFANVMAGIKNSIGRTEVKIQLDPTDPDPQKTIERVQHEVVRSRQQAFPVGTNSPMDITDWLARAGFEFTVEGHPGLPDMKVDFGEKNSSYTKPDTDLEELLRKRSIMGLGLSPETIDATYQPEFATSVVTNNILLSKRVIQIQDDFTPHLSDHCRKVAMNTEDLMNDLRQILLDGYSKIERQISRQQAEERKDLQPTDGQEPLAGLNKDIVVQRILHSFITGFDVTLPRPNSVTLDNQMVAFDKYNEALDKSLDAYVSDAFLTQDSIGNNANLISTVKAAIKARYQRRWLAENGCMTELAELTTKDEEGQPMFNLMKEMTDHTNNLNDTLGDYLKDVHIVVKSNNIINKKMGDDLEATEVPVETSGGSDFGGGSDDFSLDMGGGEDDLNNLGEDKTETETTTTTQTEEEKPAEEETPPAEGEEGGETPSV